jgi:hypothetical protein
LLIASFSTKEVKTMKRTLIIILLISLLLSQPVQAMILTANNEVELEAGTYTIHEIYRSESYWKDKKYDKEIVEVWELTETTTVKFVEDKVEDKKEYNYMCILVGTEKDGNTNVYVYYNNYDK